MQKSPEQDKIAPAIIAARGAVEPVLRDKIAHVRSEKGAEYTYQYAGSGEYVLMAVAALLEAKLLLSFDPEVVPGEMLVVRDSPTDGKAYDEIGRKIRLTALLEHPESGQWRSIELLLPFVKAAPGMNVYQAFGAAVTYGSGILTRCMLGMAAEDAEQGLEGEGDGDRKPTKRRAEPPAAEKAAEPPKPDVAPPGETKVAPENLDSFEACRQTLAETVTVGGKTFPLYLDDERARLTTRLNAASRDVAKMALLYAEIVNGASVRRAKLEGRKA